MEKKQESKKDEACSKEIMEMFKIGFLFLNTFCRGDVYIFSCFSFLMMQN